MKKLLVIDGNSILNRAFYGIRLLTNKDGLYTNAVYGMANIIERQLESLKPDYCVVAFDLKAPTFRHKAYDGYKANRKGMPEELAVQLPYAKQCMTCMGCKVLSVEGYEADDILGTLSSMAAKDGIDAYILTGDRDSLQLIDDNIKVLLVKTKETICFDRTLFKETYGVEPEQFVDVKALMGDTSDNIPGVSGIGEKTAIKLIAEFGSIDALYAGIAEAKMSASAKEKLLSGKENAYLSQMLARIDCDAPVGVSLDDCVYSGFMKKELYSLFVELEFLALIKRFGLEGVSDEIKAESSEKSDSIRDFSNIPVLKINTNDVSKELSKKAASVILSGNDTLIFFDGEKRFSCDINEDALKFFDSLKIYCYDAKAIYKRFIQKGISSPKIYLDVMLAAYVLDSTEGNFSLERLIFAQLGETLNENTAIDISVFRLAEIYEKRIVESDSASLLFDIEMPLSLVLAKMEIAGFCVDVEGIKHYGLELSARADELKERIYGFAGEEFNISSPKQLGEVLFEKMMLPVIKKNKTGYSTDADVLKKLMPYHPIIEDILDYRQMTKLKSTYADGLPKAADENGRIHSVFNQTGTATGRLSSAEPNLQNIPVRTAEGREFRKYFIPQDEDHVIIDADYSQIELRILAHIAGDEAMINAFLSGEDIHTATASKVFEVSASEITVEQRKRAKAVNFGILYGMGEYSLSEDLGISMAQAKKYIASYLAGFPSVKDYLDNIKKNAKNVGYVTTLFGRKRKIAELSSSNKNLQHFGERVAMNSPIQGTAADIIKIAMINADRALEDAGIDAKIILQVHDELILEASKECADKA
ncbi:MAG: DNA polymerase I, partial [Ruminococcaceae bacterium]|nr:DNA polymerase I [Oscillospiraceae bacterium]